MAKGVAVGTTLLEHLEIARGEQCLDGFATRRTARQSERCDVEIETQDRRRLDDTARTLVESRRALEQRRAERRGHRGLAALQRRLQELFDVERVAFRDPDHASSAGCGEFAPGEGVFDERGSIVRAERRELEPIDEIVCREARESWRRRRIEARREDEKQANLAKTIRQVLE